MIGRPIGETHGEQCDNPMAPHCLDESWRPIPDTIGLYEVSSCGRVRRTDRNRLRVTTPAGTSRYPEVVVSVNKIRRTVVVHVAVAAAFFGPRPDGKQVAHWDGNPINNHVSNLRYATPSENVNDQLRHGTHHMRSRTNCPKGHELAGDNLMAGYGRRCKTCHRDRMRARRAAS